ncbi:MAG: AsmA-like C-terminal region-containing protein [Candidatus Sulfotelmatobacter sp.]
MSISPPPRKSRKWRWIIGTAVGVLAVAAVCIRIAIARAEPILRSRVIETLSTRFRSRVELAELHVWVANGIHVDGKGLKIFGTTDPNPWEAGIQPLLEIGEFRFQTALGSLFREPMHLDTIYVDRLTMNIPPKNNRHEMANLRHRGGKIGIVVSHLQCTNTNIIINTARPGKPPLEFDVSDLRMKDVGPGQPLQFDATLINPKPVGDVHSTGLFGPLNEESPRDSLLSGHYSFTNADLGTLKGIGGILSSTGQYAGTLGRIEVNGETDTPDFRLAVSGHRVPLHTDFHAIVDGTDGDTYLDPVKARVLNSSFTARGKVVRMKSRQGHDIALNVVLDQASIQDLLQLGVKTDPPLMTGTVEMKADLHLEPGEASIPDRIKLAGDFHIPNGQFSNGSVQGKINALSIRSLGHPKLAREKPEMNVPSDLRGAFELNQGILAFSSLHFQIPGTHADLTGQYSLDGKTFDFHGMLKLTAKLSQMTTGWKSILLRPVDPFFQKDGAGTEVPFKIDGTRAAPHFGLDLHHKAERSNGNPSEAVTR